jgi:chromosome segregation ATPase
MTGYGMNFALEITKLQAQVAQLNADAVEAALMIAEAQAQEERFKDAIVKLDEHIDNLYQRNAALDRKLAELDGYAAWANNITNAVVKLDGRIDSLDQRIAELERKAKPKGPVGG